MDKLIAVRKDVQAKTEQMEKMVRTSEREYSRKMAELNKGFEARIDSSMQWSMSNDIYSLSGRHSLAWKQR